MYDRLLVDILLRLIYNGSRRYRACYGVDSARKGGPPVRCRLCIFISAEDRASVFVNHLMDIIPSILHIFCDDNAEIGPLTTIVDRCGERIGIIPPALPVLLVVYLNAVSNDRRDRRKRLDLCIPIPVSKHTAFDSSLGKQDIPKPGPVHPVSYGIYKLHEPVNDLSARRHFVPGHFCDRPHVFQVRNGSPHPFDQGSRLPW